jgi:CubicO group peptidase (beta-lactamase class C family)
LNRRQCISLAGAFALSPYVSAAASDRYGAALAAFPDFNGVVLAGVGSRILYSQAIGMADPQAGTPLAASTRFESGSVSKWIASIVVMKMVDLGLLKLDQPITAYLPAYRADTGAQLTLRHLLSHSSGVPNDIAAARKADKQVAYTELEQMAAVKRYASGDLAFKPGTAWDYSHSNWLIVKAIVEQVSGKSYADCLRQWVLAPLKLIESGLFHGESSAVPGMAIAYSAAKPPFERKLSAVPDYMVMAGGFYASAPDMLRLMDGVLGGQILSTDARQVLMRVQMPDQHYALGGRTRVEHIAGQMREAAWEDGSNGGFRLVARRVLADGQSVIVMNNTSYPHPKVGEIASALMEAGYGFDPSKSSKA